MKKEFVLITIFAFSHVNAFSINESSTLWTAEMCMRYAVEHNRTVRQRSLELENRIEDKTRAIGQFLPGISAGSNMNFNFGRSVDPETNTYKSVSTFNNGYSLSASLALFRGGSLVASLKQSQIGVLLGKAALEEIQDNIAAETYEAYINAVYSIESAEIARMKLAETDSLLRKTAIMEELGMKGAADVAQVRAQRAEDAYLFTQQENRREMAMLTLRQIMNLEENINLEVERNIPEISADKHSVYNTSGISIDGSNNPGLRISFLQMQNSALDRQHAWANLLPSLSASAGWSTSYYKTRHVDGYPSFSEQFKNNKGTYFGFSLSIPIFNRLSSITALRKARNTHRIAQEQYETKRESLQKTIAQALLDCEGAYKEIQLMKDKVRADELAYNITRRKYEEGLMTPLDVQTTSTALLNSRTRLLQCLLTYRLKCKMLDYYQGGKLY